VVLFAVVFAVVIGTRIDQNTVSLLAGTALGVMFTAPCVALIVWLVVRQRDDTRGVPRGYDVRTRSVPYLAPEPPQYWIMPSPPQQTETRLPTMNAPSVNQPAWFDPALLTARRRFVVIGEGGEVAEVRDPLAMLPGRDDEDATALAF
jgi:hypothetical protein